MYKDCQTYRLKQDPIFSDGYKEEFYVKKVISLMLLAFFIFISTLPTGCAKPKEPIAQEPKTEGLRKEEPKKEEHKKEKPKTEEPSKERLDPVDFFPLISGSTWDYEGEGNEYASFTREVLFTSGDRAQIRENNGGTSSAAVFKTSPDAVTRIFFMGEAYGEDNFINTEPKENIIILKAPLQVGTKWEEPNGTREIVDINAKVDTPAGTFEECIKVKITSEDSTLYEFYKKDIGMVKREFRSGEK
jgi:hypothetical protein